MTGRRLALVAAIVGAVAAGLAWPRLTRPDPNILTQQIEADMQAGRWDSARAGVRRLAAVRPPTPRDRLLRARVEIGAGDRSEALEELRNLLDDPELAPQAYHLTGLIERQRNRLRDAEAAYREAIRLDPRLIGARKELIYILGMQSRRRELDAQFKELARATPLTQYDLYIWCLTHFINWGTESADDLKPFLDADPEDRQSRLAMARLLLAAPGQDDRVEELLRPLPPDNPEVLAFRIEKELNRGRVDEATRMIAGTQADDPLLARLRGRIALRRGDRDAAVRHFRQALSNEPYDRVSNAELGKTLLLQGDRAGAQVYLDRVRHLDEVYNLITSIGKPKQEPQIADLKRLAHACEAAGLTAEAWGWYMLVIGIAPLDQEAQQGLHRLRAAAPVPLGPPRESGSLSR